MTHKGWRVVKPQHIQSILPNQSSRKRRFRRIITPIFAFVRVKFPSDDSHLRPIATGRPN